MQASSVPSSPPSANDYLSPDLTAQLQNVGLRVRKSVTEGYATHRFTSAPSTSSRSFKRSATTPHLFTDKSPIFRSASDTLHAVYTENTRRPPPPSKLKRDRDLASIDDEADEEGELDAEKEKAVEHHLDSAQGTNAMTGGTPSARPMKPLRRTTRPFAQTQSMPATMFGLSQTDNSFNIKAAPAVAEEEEDWSTLNFPGAS
ncbi:hypothetical protein EVG20_g24 [Dentipellis fragilis]|uniref:Uncharacterized protein n=1 Tax=Dentipellis fragilis TaxID=205917 RepID=A0A4Y9ZGI9_9AGAM|nr:hypothetical protein EVG20_g24 [Dentipellis fragilis]